MFAGTGILCGRKQPCDKSTAAVQPPDLFRQVVPLCISTDRQAVLAGVLTRCEYFYGADPQDDRQQNNKPEPHLNLRL